MTATDARLCTFARFYFYYEAIIEAALNISLHEGRDMIVSNFVICMYFSRR